MKSSVIKIVKIIQTRLVNIQLLTPSSFDSSMASVSITNNSSNTEKEFSWTFNRKSNKFISKDFFLMLYIKIIASTKPLERIVACENPEGSFKSRE